jgi:hypothetical protein
MESFASVCSYPPPPTALLRADLAPPDFNDPCKIRSMVMGKKGLNNPNLTDIRSGEDGDGEALLSREHITLLVGDVEAHLAAHRVALLLRHCPALLRWHTLAVLPATKRTT